MRLLTIAAAQSSSLKGDVAENMRRHGRFVAVAKERGADVILFPELSLTGYEPTIAADHAVALDDGLLRPLREQADRSDVVILAGCPIRSTFDKPYIGLLIFRPGQPVAAYRKRFVHSSEEPYFVASNDTVVFSARDTAIGVAICADISNPVHAADAAAHGARLYLASVAKTPEDMAKAEANLASYARKHQMAAVMANYASPSGGFATGGRSAVWDETGRLVAQAEPQGESIVLATRSDDGWTGEVVPVG
jgi:predicted amidohydrolase